MSSETDYQRIQRAQNDPYRVLNVSADATTDEVRAAYKRLVRAHPARSHPHRRFNSTSVRERRRADRNQPDRIKLPKSDGAGGRQDVLNQELKDMAAQTFKQIATACAILVDRACSFKHLAHALSCSSS